MSINECIEHGCSDLTDSISGLCELHEEKYQARRRELRAREPVDHPLEEQLAAMGAGIC
ncbi:MAG: hypothetical protein K9M17_05460 [Mariprofundaceae bacterium]|nr:hypothetical protein [Mariprofundaceae bacterium]